MMPRLAPYAIILVLAIALAAMTNMYLGKRDELAALTASVEVLGKAAEANVARVKKEGEQNLTAVKESHEKLVPTIRAGAVAAYVAAHPARVRYVAASGGSVPGTGAGKPLDDDAQSQCVPDTTLIESAAEDASKIAAWIDYCTRNRCPVAP
jgi:hypothetical protein